MKKQLTALCILLTLMTGVEVLAVGSGKTLDFNGSDMGLVIFDGTTHKNAGLICSDCHNPDMFPKMKKGTVKITMADLYAGKYCAKCHDGAKAFKVKENCILCHFKAGA